METEKESANWQVVQNNPTLYNGALTVGEGERMRWHSDADRPHSSQVFCMSAFGSLRFLKSKDATINAILESVGLSGAEEWEIELEAVYPELLSELGTPQPSSIDVLLTSRNSVFTVESKFLTDAREGFGTCSQPRSKSCAGFFGPGSDLKTMSSAWCRLELWDGKRSPRSYWSIGRGYFQESVFSKQVAGQVCPLRFANYQLMRNFLFAAAFAQRNKLSNFGLIVIAPSSNSAKLLEQLSVFKESILREEVHRLVNFVSYEQLIHALEQLTDDSSQSLAHFLKERIRSLVAS